MPRYFLTEVQLIPNFEVTSIKYSHLISYDVFQWNLVKSKCIIYLAVIQRTYSGVLVCVLPQIYCCKVVPRALIELPKENAQNDNVFCYHIKSGVHVGRLYWITIHWSIFYTVINCPLTFSVFQLVNHRNSEYLLIEPLNYPVESLLSNQRKLIKQYLLLIQTKFN